MQLYINGRFLTQPNSGVQLFAKEICKELIKIYPIIILVPKNQPILDVQFQNQLKKIGNQKGHLWEQISLSLFIQKHPEALLLNLCNTGPAFAKNQVATIHDLAFIKNPKWFNPLFANIYRKLIPMLLKNSEQIITVSSIIKQELMAEYSVNSSKIIVIGNKVPQELIDATAISPFEKGEPVSDFFLMVGSDNPRKNFAFAERIFAKAEGDTKLIIVGAKHKSFNNVGAYRIINDKIIRLDYTDNSKLKWLYQNAKALITPSHYEGFGIPNIEAMTFGCPVICSDIPVFREVCKDAALYFTLGNAAQLKQCIASAIENKELMKQKTTLGKSIAQEFQNKNRAQLLLNTLGI